MATDQATTVQPDVMLGGGSLYFLPAGADSSRTDEGVIAPLQSAGYAIVTTRAQLIAQQPDDRARLFGMFAPEHMDYVLDRDASTTQPSLAEMSLAAIRFLDTREEGFFLMIEGARIDMAAHLNDRDRMITETVDFDQAIQAVLAWAAASPDEVTVIVTADHGCGGVVVTQPAPAGAFSTVTWRWTEHTNARVDVFPTGPGSEVFDGAILDNTWVHAVLSARITGTPIAQPRSFLVPDGHLAELSHLAAVQTAASGFGVGRN